MTTSRSRSSVVEGDGIRDDVNDEFWRVKQNVTGDESRRSAEIET